MQCTNGVFPRKLHPCTCTPFRRLECLNASTDLTGTMTVEMLVSKYFPEAVGI